MSRLLVSVRSVDEATAALDGGADIIDVKEPSRGPLGRADNEVIRAVMKCVGDRAQVSAALGELADGPSPPPPGLAYVKVGLYGLTDWQRRWSEWRGTATNAVLVIYADACEVESMIEFANDAKPAAVLIDTWNKSGQTLIEHISAERLMRVRQSCKIPLALAGSLNLELIERLASIMPDIIGVRSAACRGGRHGVVDSGLVRQIANRLVRAALRG